VLFFVQSVGSAEFEEEEEKERASTFARDARCMLTAFYSKTLILSFSVWLEREINKSR
jgi:hypothetical protein